MIYLGLLAASHGYRAWRGDPADPDQPAIMVPAFTASGWVERHPPVRLAYREWAGPTASSPVVLWLHGSPGSSAEVEGLGPLLAARYRVIAPDLPGFGGSTHDVPDYSIAAHARYVDALLDRLEIDRAHVIGFSMGGGVGLELSALAPQRLRSLVLLSSIGVQDLELLGEYHVNHALHALQLGGLWLLEEATPHFGLFDGWLLDSAYARNFFDTDQRPLRDRLRGFEPPMLIIHGRDDVLVPYAAAVEHHRLVPQSELITFDANHFMVFRQPQRLAPPLLDFFARVDAGAATARADVGRDRRVAALAARGGAAPPARGLGLLVFVVLLALATMVSEDLTCIAAGLLVAQGRIPFVAAAGACFVGIFFGDLLLYAAGRWLGQPWLQRIPLRWFVRPDEVARSRRWFVQRGATVIFLSRFVPGTRIPTYVAAGVLRMPVVWFALRLLIPVALWTPLLVGAAALAGERLLPKFEAFSRYAVVGAVGLLVTVWLVLFVARSLASHRGRRLLVGRWLRWTRWEYWPLWALYPPVVLYILWLGWRHRGATVFTAVNPGIPSGGFADESKLDILRRLAPGAVPPVRAISAGWPLERQRRAVETFLAEEHLDYPVVLKPDAGERGAGVAVIRDAAQLEPYFRRAVGKILVQKYVPGPELGIFYIRHPGAERGELFSITEKRLPSVVGDGERSLEQLILADPRAVVRAKRYLERFAAELERVPAAGEVVRLGELGVHSRGALFLDGAELATPALADAIETISRSFEGFYFGRFDVKAPSRQAFREGRDLQVLELNGVTAEATHVYAPGNSLWNFYRVLFEQWRQAFEIGAANRARGVAPMPVRDLLQLVLRYRKKQRARS